MYREKSIKYQTVRKNNMNLKTARAEFGLMKHGQQWDDF